MLNYTDAKKFLPALPNNKAILVSTEYDRPDKLTPFVSPVVLHLLQTEGKVTVNKQKGAYLYSVQRK